jgi:hypothetical protein
VRGPEERKHAEHVNLRDGAVSDAATLWTRAQDLVVLAHRVQRRVHCFALPIRDTFPRASTEERQGEARQHTGVGNHDVEPARDLLDLLDGRAVVRLVRGRELDDVQLARVRLRKRLQLACRCRLPRARKDDSVGARRKRLGEPEACGARALALDMSRVVVR